MSRDGFLKKHVQTGTRWNYIILLLIFRNFFLIGTSLACFSSLSFAEGREEEKNKESESHLHYKTITWTNCLHSTSLFATAVVSHQRRQNTGGRAFFFESSIWSFDFCSIKKSTVGLWRNFWRGERIILCIWPNDCQNLHNKTAENIQFCKD